jgi:hypothetical protein
MRNEKRQPATKRTKTSKAQIKPMRQWVIVVDDYPFFSTMTRTRAGTKAFVDWSKAAANHYTVRRCTITFED